MDMDVQATYNRIRSSVTVCSMNESSIMYKPFPRTREDAAEVLYLYVQYLSRQLEKHCEKAQDIATDGVGMVICISNRYQAV